KVNRDLLRARGLGILDVVNAVHGANLLLPSGELRAGDVSYNVFTNTQVDEARPLRDVVVRQGTITPGTSGTTSAPGASQQAVTVGDVATVEDSSADQSNVVRVNGRRGVYLRVFKQPGANTIAVVDSLRNAINQFRGVPPNITLTISF